MITCSRCIRSRFKSASSFRSSLSGLRRSQTENRTRAQGDEGRRSLGSNDRRRGCMATVSESLRFETVLVEIGFASCYVIHMLLFGSCEWSLFICLPRLRPTGVCRRLPAPRTLMFGAGSVEQSHRNRNRNKWLRE